MKHLSIDIETRSSVDIGKAGLYRNTPSPPISASSCLPSRKTGIQWRSSILPRERRSRNMRSGCLLIRMSRNMRITRRLSGTA